MCHAFQPGQPQKTAGPLNSVNQSEDIAKKFRVVGILFQFDQFHVQNVHVLRSLGQKFIKKIVHSPNQPLSNTRRSRSLNPRSMPPDTFGTPALRKLFMQCLRSSKFRPLNYRRDGTEAALPLYGKSNSNRTLTPCVSRTSNRPPRLPANLEVK